MFVDASAIIAIVAQDEGWESLALRAPLLFKGNDFVHTDILVG